VRNGQPPRSRVLASDRLPSGWALISIEETGEYINGFAFKAAHRTTSGRPIIRIQNLTDESKALNRTKLAVSTEYEVATGDMLVSWSATLDVFVWQREPALVNQHIFKVISNAEVINKRLLFYWLKLAISQLMDTDHLHGSTMKHINRGPFLAHRVPLPPKQEQTRIVDKLEELLSDLDAGVAELKAAQKKLAQYRQSLLKAAVEGRLTEAWRAQHGEPEESGAQLLARILRERRAQWEAKQLAKFEAQCKVPAKGWQNRYPELLAHVDAELEVLPAGWTWATVDQLADVGTGVTPLRSKPQYFVNGTIPWVTSGALNDEIVKAAKEHVTDLALKECRLDVYPAGSLLVAMYGEGKTRGKCAELAFPATINQAIACLVFESPSDACKSFVKLFLQKSYESMREQASGGVQPNLNLQIVKSIVLPLPPLSEQAEIAKSITRYFEQLHQQAEAIQHALRQSAAQRKNILQAAFSGQLVPQDPNDEPASVLLERIRAERMNQPAQSRKPRVSRKAP
jgi:type I restriction enzyme S subunit